MKGRELRYTNDWSSNFFGFQYLIKTFENTESPLRLKPMNLYYHMYSGEKEESLKALISNLEYIQNQKDIIPITAQEYSQIAQGFYTTEFNLISPNIWKVSNRGALQTIRFDNATLKTVNYRESTGVIGQSYLHGSLYIYLDKSVKSPIIALQKIKSLSTPILAQQAYLSSSRWQIAGVHRSNNRIAFTAHGFGQSNMTWIMPQNGKYDIFVNGVLKNSEPISNNMLIINLPNAQNQLNEIQIKNTSGRTSR